MERIIINKDELIELLRQTFLQGANSHDNWLGRCDTLWTQIHNDCKNYLEIEIEDFLKNLTK